MKLRALLGDLGSEPVDAVVRATSVALVGRSRDALLQAAGPQARDACRELRRTGRRGGLQVGEVVSTPAGELPARWLLHVAVPDYSLRSDRSHLLSSAYRACLEAADGLGARTLALAPFGTVPPYWPLQEATRLCLGTLSGSPTRVDEVRLVLSSPGGLELFAEALARRRS